MDANITKQKQNKRRFIVNKRKQLLSSHIYFHHCLCNKAAFLQYLIAGIVLNGFINHYGFNTAKAKSSVFALSITQGNAKNQPG